MMHDDAIAVAVLAATKARAALAKHDEQRGKLLAAVKQADAWANGLARLVERVYAPPPQVLDVVPVAEVA